MIHDLVVDRLPRRQVLDDDSIVPPAFHVPVAGVLIAPVNCHGVTGLRTHRPIHGHVDDLQIHKHVEEGTRRVVRFGVVVTDGVEFKKIVVEVGRDEDFVLTTVSHERIDRMRARAIGQQAARLGVLLVEEHRSGRGIANENLLRPSDGCLASATIRGRPRNRHFARSVRCCRIQILDLQVRVVGPAEVVAEIYNGRIAVVDEHSAVPQRRHIAPLQDFGDGMMIDRQSRDDVLARAVRHGRWLTGIERPVLVHVDEDRPAAQGLIVLVADSVGVVVVPLRAGDSGVRVQLIIEEVNAGVGSFRLDEELPIAARDDPSRLKFLSNPIGIAGRNITNEILSDFARSGRRGRERLVSVAVSVAIDIDVDGPAAEARFMSLAKTIAIEVIPLGAGDAGVRQLKVAEVFSERSADREEKSSVAACHLPANLWNFTQRI